MMKILSFAAGFLAASILSLTTTASRPRTGTDLVGPPIIELASATNNTDASIDILTYVNFNGLRTSVRVCWGMTEQYDDSTDAQTVEYYPAPPLVFPISGLEPATMYHFRVVAQNDSGVALTDDLTASTSRIITLPADSITATSARLNGRIIANGGVVEANFGIWMVSGAQFNGPFIPIQTFQVDSGAITYSYTLTGLLPNTTYRFMVHANYEWGSNVKFTTLDAERGSMLSVPLTFQTQHGYTRTIHFGVHTYATNCYDFSLGEAELPPFPPTVEFPEPRFRGCGLGLGTEVDFHAYLSASQIDTYRVSVPAGLPELYPIRVVWPHLDSLYEGPVILKAPDNVVDMKSATSYDISDDNVTFLLIIASNPHPSDHSLTAITNRTSDISQTQAHISALLFPRQLPIAAWFEWGIDVSYGSSSPLQSVDANSILNLLETTIDGLQGGTLYHYRLVAQDSTGPTPGADQSFMTQAVAGIEPHSLLPDKVALAQNYPNPFNPVTRIEYMLPRSEHVRLAVYNLLGQEVALLADGILDAGWKYMLFDGSTFSSGLYFCRLQAGHVVAVKKMLLMK